MYEHIFGKIDKLSPTYVVIDVGGVGYIIHISLTTYSFLQDKDTEKLLIHPIYREDAQQLYGFYEEAERALFRLLISVSGVGANTARMMLSSLKPQEIKVAIATGQVNVLKSIKGIGARTAERIIVDLKDKVNVDDENENIFIPQDNTITEEALSALVMLGFQKKQVEKAVGQILKADPTLSVEGIIKAALKRL